MKIKAKNFSRYFKKVSSVTLCISSMLNFTVGIPQYSLVVKAENEIDCSTEIDTSKSVSDLFHEISYQNVHTGDYVSDEKTFNRLPGVYFGGNSWSVVGIDKNAFHRINGKIYIQPQSEQYPAVVLYSQCPYECQIRFNNRINDNDFQWHNQYCCKNGLYDCHIREYLTSGIENLNSFQAKYFRGREIELNTLLPCSYESKKFNYDLRWNNHYYTYRDTESMVINHGDKFYLPSGKFDDRYIYLGIKDVNDLNDSNYEPDTTNFPVPISYCHELSEHGNWLRSSDYSSKFNSLYARYNGRVDLAQVNRINYMSPACRLPISSILFASDVNSCTQCMETFFRKYARKQNIVLTIHDTSTGVNSFLPSNIEGNIKISADNRTAVFEHTSGNLKDAKIALLCYYKLAGKTVFQFIKQNSNGIYNLPIGVTNINVYVYKDSTSTSQLNFAEGFQDDRYQVRYAKRAQVSHVMVLPTNDLVIK